MNDYSDGYNMLQPNQVSFLEQLSDQEFWNHAQSLANPQNALSTTSEEALECHTSDGHYLLPLRALCEVVPPPHKLTRLPLHPPWMLGITAWRGHIIPVVDLASYFFAHTTHKLDTARDAYAHSNSLLLILDDSDALLGIQIAVVGSIIALEEAQLELPEQAPSWYPPHLLTMLLGVYNGLVILNTPVLIAEMMQHIKVSTAYE
jgi:chemotaxis signal transduction protein